MMLRKMVDFVLLNDAKYKCEHEHLMLSVDLKFSNQLKTIMKSRIGRWLRKHSSNGGKIVANLKHKRKKRLEKFKSCDFKEDLR